MICTYSEQLQEFMFLFIEIFNVLLDLSTVNFA